MGAQEDNGLTLEALAQRLEALERENERMRSENAELRGKVATLEGSGTSRREKLAEKRGSGTERSGEAALAFEGRVSRRSLLSKAGAAAVAAMAAGTLLNPREAKAADGTFDNVYAHSVNATQNGAGFRAILATNNSAAVGFGTIEALNQGSGSAVSGESKGSGPAVAGVAAVNAGGAGVKGSGDTGVWGTTQRSGYSGVYGEHTADGYGVVGDGEGINYAGVLGRSPTGTGVRGEGSTQQEVAGVRGIGKTGVWGSTSVSGYSGVYGQHTGTAGHGVVGDGKGASAGVLGRNSGGAGVQGEGVIGVRGKSTTAGEAGVYAEHRVTDGPGVVADGKGPSHAGVLGRSPDGSGVWGQASATGYEGVYGQHTGTSGYGVVGDGKGESGAGILGRNQGGTGMKGESSQSGYGAITGEHTGTSGYGVIGLGKGSGAGILGRNSGGYGGQFEGGKAQLMLKPAASAGKPTSGTHSKGEIYMDSAGALFVCTAGDGTTVGTWKKVNMKLV